MEPRGSKDELHRIVNDSREENEILQQDPQL